MITIKFIIFAGIILSNAAYGGRVFLKNVSVFINLTYAEKGIDERTNDPKKNECHKESCKELAKDIINSIDPSINPCDDFYSYACGGWIKMHPVPPNKSRLSRDDILQNDLRVKLQNILEKKANKREPETMKSARRFYHSCMNLNRMKKKGLKPLVEILEKFNDWPMTTSNWDETKFDWPKLSIDLARKTDTWPLFSVSVENDMKNNKTYIPYINLPTNMLSKTMINSGLFDSNQYTGSILKMAQLVAEAKKENISMKRLKIDANEILDFELKLGNALPWFKNTRNREDIYNLVTIKKLQKWTDDRKFTKLSSRLNWKSFFKYYVGEYEENITDETPVVVTTWEFLENVLRFVDETSPRVLANHIYWQTVWELADSLEDEISSINKYTVKPRFAFLDETPKRIKCITECQLYFDWVLGYMFVKEYFDEKTKIKATTMLKEIQWAVKKELADARWMDDETKKAAFEKANLMRRLVGYPTWYDSITAVDDKYIGLEIGDDFFENKVRLEEFHSKLQIKKLYEVKERDEWLFGAAVFNAFYSTRNYVMIPAAILQPPYFDKDRPQSLNYGGLGFLLGHEISHAFDFEGKQFDKYGHLNDWWTEETEDLYLEKSYCFINQYRNFKIPELSEKLKKKVSVNGKRTLSENISDNGGLRAALRAYLKYVAENGDYVLPGLEHLTPEQLFYIGFAQIWCESETIQSLMADVTGDNHSPKKFRVLGSLHNLEHFGTTWGCKLGSKMNPEKKCKIL